MALGNNERQRSAVPVQDLDGRLIVVGPNGVPIAGGGGAGGDPLSDGDPAGALPTKTLWVAGADGTVLRGMVVDATGRLRTVVEGTPNVAVSNFPASQPVSGPLTDTQLRAAAVPVSGTFWQATQPVSGPLTDTQLRASAVNVQGPAITKGTQGTVGHTVQDLKDAGRTAVLLSAAGVASVTTETAISLQQLKGTTATAGVGSYTVTAGKTLRIQAIQFGVRFTTMSTTVTFGSVTFRMRLTSITGAIALQDSKAVASNVPTPNSDLTIPDGWELPAGTVILFSQAASVNTLSVDVLLVGYEY
jgi:hypothetical protein